MSNFDNKEQYIAKRYFPTKGNANKRRLFNGYHLKKQKRIARHFTSFYPDPEIIRKESVDPDQRILL